MKFSKSLTAVYAVILVFLCMMPVMRKYRKSINVINNDVKIYYGYLPSYFLYDDIKAEKGTYYYKDQTLFWNVPYKEGGWGYKMTYGVSLFYLPFFASAHLIAGIMDFDQDGFSEPYCIAIILSSIFFLGLGLLLVRKLLLYWKFSEGITAITILLLGLTTNIFNYSTVNPGYSHTYSFFLFALFLYATIKFKTLNETKWLAVVALTFGLITVVRPSNAVVFLIYLLYGKSSIKDVLKTRITIKEIFYFGTAGLLLWMPQMYYWHKVSGHWFVNSYVDERFFFDNPKFYRGLLSFRKGWLIYTPVMFFALFGFFIRKRFENIRPALLIFLILNLYVIFSWWCWWYGGGFGMRPLIESYALLSIPLAAFIEYITRKKAGRVSLAVLCIFFTWLNVFQTFQYNAGSLHYEAMNQKLYFKQFGKMKKVEGWQDMLSEINTESAKRGER